MRWTPYRRGLEAGRIHAEAFKAWRVQPLGERGPSPRPPANPYSKLKSMDDWAVGFQRSVALGS